MPSAEARSRGEMQISPIQFHWRRERSHQERLSEDQVLTGKMLKKDSFVELSFCEMAISTNGHWLDWVFYSVEALDGNWKVTFTFQLLQTLHSVESTLASNTNHFRRTPMLLDR